MGLQAFVFWRKIRHDPSRRCQILRTCQNSVYSDMLRVAELAGERNRFCVGEIYDSNYWPISEMTCFPEAARGKFSPSHYDLGGQLFEAQYESLASCS